MFLGVLAYLLKQPPENHATLSRYLSFIAKNQVHLPFPDNRLETGYKSCIEVEPNQTCLLQGAEWYWLNLLSKRAGLELPNLPDATSAYGYDLRLIEWSAAFAPLLGDAYELHLVATQIYLAQKAGLNDPVLKRAAAILAARQPNNPFYLYLHLNKDKRVSDAISQKCSADLPRDFRRDWAWRRDENYESAWKVSMGWDCIFAINLLLN
jgi:hypothetical protein